MTASIPTSFALRRNFLRSCWACGGWASAWQCAPCGNERSSPTCAALSRFSTKEASQQLPAGATKPSKPSIPGQKLAREIPGQPNISNTGHCDWGFGSTPRPPSLVARRRLGGSEFQLPLLRPRCCLVQPITARTGANVERSHQARSSNCQRRVETPEYWLFAPVRCQSVNTESES